MTTSKIIENRIDQAIVNEPLLRGCAIDIMVVEGRVVLSGTVNQYRKKLLAEKVAATFGHPRTIDQLIKVVPDTLREDDYIHDEIVKRWMINLGFSSDKAFAKVSNGYVHIEGQVPWNYQRDLALQSISDIDGICDIQNNMTVSPVSNEQIIKRQIFDILPMVTAHKIELDIVGFDVTLSGIVSSVDEKECINEAIRKIPGIGKITDEIKIQTD